MQNKFQILNSEKGVSLIITFFVMIIILAIVLSVSVILYSEIKVIRNIGDSMVGFYAADSGIEKVLYYDNQVLPDPVDGKSVAVRGLCSMYPYGYSTATWINLKACPSVSSGVSGNSSIFCEPNSGFLLPQSPTTDGCDPSVCDNCKISFSATLSNGATYSTTAQIYPAAGSTDSNKISDFDITSKGSFSGASRQVKISITSTESGGTMKIENACADPKSGAQGTTINIAANVNIISIGTDTIGKVTASIYDADGNYYDANGSIVSSGSDAAFIPLTLISGDYTSGRWSYNWITSTGTSARVYHVNIDAWDTLTTPNHTTLQNILPCGF